MADTVNIGNVYLSADKVVQFNNAAGTYAANLQLSTSNLGIQITPVISHTTAAVLAGGEHTPAFGVPTEPGRTSALY